MQGREHDRDSTLHVGDSGAAQNPLFTPEDLLEFVIGPEHRVHVAGEEELDRSVRANLDMKVAAVFHRPQRAVRRHDVNRVRLDETKLSRKGGEGVGEQGSDLAEPVEIA